MQLGIEAAVVRLLVGFAIGFVIGFERYNRKEAGSAPYAVVCVTATALTILSAYGFGDFANTRTMDRPV